MEARLLRALYVFEFLLALMAVYSVWSHIGGNHFDLMAWWWKVALGFGAAYATVRATAAALTSERAWGRRTLRWLTVLLALTVAAGLVTYYYHLYEPSDQEEEPGTNATARWNLPVRPGSHPA
jgi:hypothetical protein